MRALILVLLFLASACAPTRDEVVDAHPFPNDYQSALFAIETPAFGSQWEMGKLTLVDDDVGCDVLDTRGEYPGWSMENGVPYVTIWIRHGVALDGWLRDYPAYEQWLRDNPYQEQTDDVTFFWGEMGTGGDGGEPPPVDGREVTALLGQGATALEDLVSVGVSNTGSLAGTLTHGDGEEVSFTATKCESVVSTWF
jgi:hypothetical protein